MFMWIWDGTDREEGDAEAALVDTFKRALMSKDPAQQMRMRSYVAGISLALTKSRSSELVAPAPLIQGGFTPSDDERHEMCQEAKRTGRDLIHICFYTDGSCVPTGLMNIIYNDEGCIRLHSRSSLAWSQKAKGIVLWGVEDERDTTWVFFYRPGAKLRRREISINDIHQEALIKAGSQVTKLIENNAIGNVAQEPLRFYHQIQGGPTIA